MLYQTHETAGHQASIPPVSGALRRSSMALSLLALSAAALALYLAAHPPTPPKFALYIDAGSTGSRIHVFAYRPGRGAAPVAVDVGLTASMKVSPGLSSFARDPERAGEGVVELVEFGRARVPRELWGETEVRLMATAGMRLVQAAVAERILEACRKVMRSSGFVFRDHWASVISGR